MPVERVGGADALVGVGVTAREAEVLAAVAQRLRNGEIAERLFIRCAPSRAMSPR